MRYTVTIRFIDGEVMQIDTPSWSTVRQVSKRTRSIVVTENGNGSQLVYAWYADRIGEFA